MHFISEKRTIFIQKKIQFITPKKSTHFTYRPVRNRRFIYRLEVSHHTPVHLISNVSLADLLPSSIYHFSRRSSACRRTSAYTTHPRIKLTKYRVSLLLDIFAYTNISSIYWLERWRAGASFTTRVYQKHANDSSFRWKTEVIF